VNGICTAVVDQLYAIEIEPEMRDWLEALPAKHFLKVDEYVGLLAEHAAGLGEPYARHPGDGVRELRPAIDDAAIRIAYWLTPQRTAVLLTVFRKTRMREDAEVRRAKTAQKICEAEHGPAHDEFVRVVEEGETERCTTPVGRPCVNASSPKASPNRRM
jgi:hypothetical protein